MPRKALLHVGRKVWANLAVIALLFSVVPGTYLYVKSRDLSAQSRKLAVQNRHRISDIQKSRLASCEKTYESFREVFKPFFRPAAVRTPKETHDINLFNKTIATLKAKCKKQISTKGAS